MAITDLTNTTWHIPAGWSATQRSVYFVSGELSIGDTDYGLPSLTALTIDSTRISFAHGSWDDNINITPSQSFTITFETVSAQSGYTVDQLISWLEANGELQGGEEPEAPTNAVTVEYNGSVIAAIEGGKAASISCKDKLMRTDIVITVPEMGGSVEEWDGSYTISGGTISFTIEGEHYEAEEGMTWAEFAESEYNTASVTISRAGVDGANYDTVHRFYPVTLNGNDVKPDDAIIADAKYRAVYTGGGGSN